jgi:hypothetical protein
MFAVLIDQFWSLTIAGIALGFIYVLVSLGYTMVYGVLRMINFANSEIFMWGTFGAVVSNRDLFKYTQTSEPATGFKLLVVLFTGLLISMFIAALTAVFVEFVAYRRLRMRGTNRLATLISAIGVSIALAEVMRLLTDSRPVGSPRVLEKIILTDVWGANIRLDTVITIIAAAVIYFILERFIKLSRMGKAIRAVSQNENAEQNITNGDPNAYTNVMFKYKDMGDYLSKTYKQSYPLAREGYGGRIFNTSNFYGKGDKVVETLCGTLIPASFSTDKIVGRTWDIDGTLASGTIKALQTGYRLAQYNLIEGQTEWAYQYGVSGNTALSVGILKMPFVSHIDNPYAPNVDLAFGQPRLVYYNAVNASGTPYAYTNNNLYNTYWLNYINETVSQEALQLELTMMLSSVDIYQLDFRKPIYYGGIRWRLLEIRDYLVGQMKPCRVTLRRILNLADFAATTTTPIANDPSALFNGPIDPDPVDPGYEPPINPELPSEG